MRKTLALVAVLALLSGACGDDEGDGGYGATATPTTVAAATGSTFDPPAAHGNEGSAGNCSPPGPSVSIVADNMAFDKTSLAVPANQAVTVTFENRQDVPHGFTILEAQNSSNFFFQEAPFRGPRTVTLNVGPLRRGDFAFKCQVHPNTMFGMFSVG